MDKPEFRILFITPELGNIDSEISGFAANNSHYSVHILLMVTNSVLCRFPGVG